MKITKENIILNSVKLFNELGYKNVTVDKICEACGVTKGSFYHHFKSKDDVILQYWAYQYVLNEKSVGKILSSKRTYKKKLWGLLELGINAAVNDIGRSSMAELWRVDLKQGNKVLCAEGFMNGSGPSPEYNEILMLLIENAQTAGEIKNQSSPRDLLYVYYSALFGESVKWAMSEEDYDVAARLYKSFLTVFD